MSKIERFNPAAFLDPLIGKEFSGEWPTIPEMFLITEKRFGSRPCFTDFEGVGGNRHTLSYTEVKERVLRLSSWLASKGVGSGDKVAVTGKNSPEWATVYLATLFVGATICPIDWALHIEEQENLLATAKPKLFFVDDEKYPHYSEKHHGGENDFDVYQLFPSGQSERYVYNLHSETEVSYTLPAENDLAAILFTSGTTSRPKGVMLSHKNLVSDAYIAQTNLTILPEDVFYVLLPIHHAYTMQASFIVPLSVGSEIVYGKSLAVSRLLKELKEGKITIMLGVPMLFNKLAAGIQKGIKSKGPVVSALMSVLMFISYIIKKLFGVNLGKKIFKAVLLQANLYTIRIAISGGGPLAKSVFKFFNQIGIDFVQGYGLTETSPIVALNPKEHFKIESVGSYFKGYMDMRIDSPDANGVGEICIKGPMVMQGYYGMPEETAKVMTGDGYFRTGDLGYLDSENYLMLAGRAKNMIVTEGGKNVYPEEIEDMFQLETDIQQIVVQGYISDKEKRTEGIEALVYPSDELFKRFGLTRDDATIKSSAADDVQAAVNRVIHGIVEKVNRQLLPYQRIDRVVVLREPLEITTTMKIKRNYNK